MFVPTALLSLLFFATILTLLHCFLFGMAERRSNTTLCWEKRQEGGQGTAVEQSINPKCRSLRKWGKWALLEGAVTALQSSGWCAPVHSILSCSLVNKNLVLLDSPQSSFSQCSERHQSEGASFHCKLLHCPPAYYIPMTQPHAKPWSQSFGQPVRGIFQCVCIVFIVITMVSHCKKSGYGINNLPEESL